MKVSELRIGNIVNHNGPDGEHGWQSGWITITGFTKLSGKDAIISEAGTTVIDHPFVRPQPLTNEWLERFGFESVGDLHPTYRKNPFLVEANLMQDGKFYIRNIMNSEDSLCLNPSNQMQYVHQLQNIYFALTGEELNEKK